MLTRLMSGALAVLVSVVFLGQALPIGSASTEPASTEPTSFEQALAQATAAQPVARRPTTIYRSMFETVAPSAPFDLVLQVREFAPGAWTSVHMHPAPTFITILEGEITNIPIVDGQKGEPVVYRPGDSFSYPAWEGHEAGNDGAVRARWLQTRLVPRGVPAAVNLPIASSRPNALDQAVPYTASMEILNVSGPIDVYQSWTEFSPGNQNPPHVHPGAELILVTDGELTSMKREATLVLAGEAIRNQPGEIHAAANTSPEPARVVTTHLIASGRPQTFQVE
jgi:quercetin dioxygenase-like cupin family protein